jgi:hypothetical protein
MDIAKAPRDVGLHARAELSIIEAGIAANVSGLWKPRSDGRVRTADQSRDAEAQMGTMTYYVALAFKKAGDGGDIVACDPREARSSEQAVRIAGALAKAAGHCGPSRFRGLAILRSATSRMR